MKNTNGKKYQIVDTLGLGDGVLYHEDETDKEYLVIPKQDLNAGYGTFFIREDLLFTDNWSDEVNNALVKSKSKYKQVKESGDYTQSRAFYKDILKVSSDMILPTIAEVSGDSRIKVATEDLALDATTYHEIDDHGEPSYVFPF